jgi:di/tripeptidase
MVLGRPAIVGESPVCENFLTLCSILSKTGHEKPCLNLGGPPSKAKYEIATDSERVP